MQVRIKLLFVSFLMLSLFASCEKQIEDSVPPAYNVTYVRFVSSLGTNILDSLNVLGPDEVMGVISPQQMTFTERHTSNAYSCDFQKHFVRVSPEQDYRFVKTETLVKFEWTDFNIMYAKNGETYIYAFDMKSKEIFGNDDTHTLKWHLNILHNTHDAFKCEIDDKEVDLKGDSFYSDQKSDKKRMVKGLVTIVCR